MLWCVLLPCYGFIKIWISLQSLPNCIFIAIRFESTKTNKPMLYFSVQYNCFFWNLVIRLLQILDNSGNNKIMIKQRNQNWNILQWIQNREFILFIDFWFSVTQEGGGGWARQGTTQYYSKESQIEALANCMSFIR